MKHKQFQATDLQVDKAKREILCVGSDDSIDRDGEIVLPSGLRKKDSTGKTIQYAGRPVLWSHDKQIPAIGSILWLKQTNNQIVFKYRISDKTQFSRDIFDLVQDDCLKFHSIGFEVFEESSPSPLELKNNKSWEGARNVIRDFEILELSICNVPCNPDASVLVKSYSPETQQLLDWQDCWEYSEKAETIAKEPEEVKQIVIPTPKYAKSWEQKKLEIALNTIAKHNAEELILKIKGKA